METNRYNEALTSFRRNLRLALKAIGMDREHARFLPPPAEADLFNGVDTTPGELVAYVDYLRQLETSQRSGLERLATVGAALEMGMHEVNTEMYTALSIIQSVSETEPQIARQLEGAESALRRLSTSLRIFHKASTSSSSNSLTGKDIHDTVRFLFEREASRAKVVIEASEEFLAAKIQGDTSTVLPAIINLVRNAWYWSEQSSNPRVIRLHADTVSIPSDGGNAWDDYVLRVEDSGPGIPEGMDGKIFLPFVSGRGSSGIGLYLSRRHLHESGLTVILDEARSELGGAVFKIGRRVLLEPIPPEPLPYRQQMLLTAGGIEEMLLDGRQEDVLRFHAQDYADILKETLRIRIEGAADDLDENLVQIADAIHEILQQVPSHTP